LFLTSLGLGLGLVRDNHGNYSYHDGFHPREGEKVFFSIFTEIKVKGRFGHQTLKCLEVVFIIFLEEINKLVATII